MASWKELMYRMVSTVTTMNPGNAIDRPTVFVVDAHVSVRESLEGYDADLGAVRKPSWAVDGSRSGRRAMVLRRPRSQMMVP